MGSMVPTISMDDMQKISVDTFRFDDEVEFIWGTKKNPGRRIKGWIINPPTKESNWKAYIKAETGRKLWLSTGRIMLLRRADQSDGSGADW